MSDVGRTAMEAVEAARDEARESGISEELAAAHVAQGALEAAETLGPEAVADIEASLPPDIVETARAEAQKQEEEH